MQVLKSRESMFRAMYRFAARDGEGSAANSPNSIAYKEQVFSPCGLDSQHPFYGNRRTLPHDLGSTITLRNKRNNGPVKISCLRR